MGTKTIPQFIPYLDTREAQAVADCVNTTWLTEGPQAELFTRRLGELMQCQHVVLAPNGTLSIYLALRALGIGPGDEVVVPDFTFYGTASAVVMTGARPVFCDIDPETTQTTAELMERAITSATRALLPVHLYGSSCDMPPIVDLARRRGFMIIEDAAQAIGVFQNGRHAGTWGDAGCFSFFADKTVTTGEGGAVVTADPKTAECLMFLRNQGRLNRGTFVHPEMGFNFRMTDMQAAVGVVQLSKLDEIIRRKQEVFAQYRQCLADVREVRFIGTTRGSTHVPFRVAVYAHRCEELTQHLQSAGIQTRSFFYPLHLQPKLAEFAREAEDGAFPGSVQAYRNGLCLPSHPALPPDDIILICDAIKTFYA